MDANERLQPGFAESHGAAVALNLHLKSKPKAKPQAGRLAPQIKGRQNNVTLGEAAKIQFS